MSREGFDAFYRVVGQAVALIVMVFGIMLAAAYVVLHFSLAAEVVK